MSLRGFALLLLIPLCACREEQVLDHGRFKDVRVVQPDGAPSSVAVLLSDAAGWSRAEHRLAAQLADDGALVIGIQTPALLKLLEDDGVCSFPGGDLENLSRFVQAYYQLPGYHPPVLVGRGIGASLAYGVLAQAPAGSYTGGLTLGFCAQRIPREPLCKGSGLDYRHDAQNRATAYLPDTALGLPLIDLHGAGDASCAAAETRDFLKTIPQSESRVLAGVDASYPLTRRVRMPLRSAYATLAGLDEAAKAAPLPPDLEDLPIIEVPAETQSLPAHADSFAIFYSGDGGWAGLDKDIAGALAAKGIPVVGVDALRYFWSERTPAGSSADLARVISHYLKAWGKSRVILIGYSQGADVLPFMLNRLPAETRAQVSLFAPIAIARQAAWEFHLSNWVGGSGDVPTLPELERLAGSGLLCIYGDEDEDAICPELDPKKYRLVQLPGGHHFDGDYDRIAAIIIAALPR